MFGGRFFLVFFLFVCEGCRVVAGGLVFWLGFDFSFGRFWGVVVGLGLRGFVVVLTGIIGG